MLAFEKQVFGEADERAYQLWLQTHPTGIVISLKVGPTGKFSVHSASCRTLQFPLENTRSKKRSGKLCFENWSELHASAARYPQVRGELNRCTRPECKGL